MASLRRSIRSAAVAFALMMLYTAVFVNSQQTTYDPIAGATVVVSIEYGFDGSPIATVTQAILAHDDNNAGPVGNGGRVQEVATSICSTEGCPVEPTVYEWTSWNEDSSAVIYTDTFTVSTPPASPAQPVATGSIMGYQEYAAANPQQAQTDSGFTHKKRSYATLTGLLGTAVLAIALVNFLV